jgi:predicted nuclease of predicted toxin-antitoxin system
VTVVVDENIPSQLIDILRSNNFDTLSIRESNRSADDYRIIEIVKSKQGVLITEDKDFGEWVFVHGVKDLSVILLRYGKHDIEKVLESTVKVLQQWEIPHRPLFITITKNKIRKREI